MPQNKKIKTDKCSQEKQGEWICEVPEDRINNAAINLLKERLVERVKRRLTELKNSSIDISYGKIYECRFNVGFFSNEELTDFHSELNKNEKQLDDFIIQLESYSRGFMLGKDSLTKT
jgi:hypothetical protein